MIVRDPGKAGEADITFQPAPRADVRIAGIAFGDQTAQPSPDHIVVRDLTLARSSRSARAT